MQGFHVNDEDEVDISTGIIVVRSTRTTIFSLFKLFDNMVCGFVKIKASDSSADAGDTRVITGSSNNKNDVKLNIDLFLFYNFFTQSTSGSFIVHDRCLS